MLLLALLLGIPALISGVLKKPERGEDADYRIRRATAAGLGVWLLTGIVLFSDMARLHPRYVEGLVPAVTATFGIGAAWATSSIWTRTADHAGGEHGRADLLRRATAVRPPGKLVDRARRRARRGRVRGPGARPREPLGRAPQRCSRRATLALTLLAIAAIPLEIDNTAIENRVSDAGYIGALPGEEQRELSAYLIAHQDGAHYELAAESATGIGSLIVQDARPVVILTTYEARVFTSVAKLERLIAEGKVRYAFLETYCGEHTSTTNAACSAPAKWIRAHGTDVSWQAGLSHDKILYLLPGAKP